MAAKRKAKMPAAKKPYPYPLVEWRDTSDDWTEDPRGSTVCFINGKPVGAVTLTGNQSCIQAYVIGGAEYGGNLVTSWIGWSDFKINVARRWVVNEAKYLMEKAEAAVMAAEAKPKSRRK